MLNTFAHMTREQLVLAFALAITVLSIGFTKVAPVLLPKLANFWGTHFKFSFRAKATNVIHLGSITLSDDDRMRHTHIVGATGVGKTVLLEHLIYRDLARGYGALIIDPKGEREFYDRILDYCIRIGRGSDIRLLSSTHLSESSRWNPCRLGDASELQSKFYCSSKYEHSFFAKAAELGLLRAFETICGRSDDQVTLSDLVKQLDGLSQGGRDENLKGLYFDIQNLAHGEWGSVLGTKNKTGNQSEVSLFDIVRKNEILFVDLPTEGKSVQSARVGSLLLQEMTLISGMRKRLPQLRSERPFSIYVDEFDAFATDPFVTFLNKGRSSGFMIHMAHQTLADLTKVSPTFQGQIMGNPNVRFVFRMDLADDAEMLSRQFGTQIATKRTTQSQDGASTGMASVREVQEFRIHPDAIKELGTGECVVSIKTKRKLEVIKVPDLSISNLPYTSSPTHRGALQKISSIKEEKSKKSSQYQSFPDVEVSL